jgi:hypothetical protein
MLARDISRTVVSTFSSLLWRSIDEGITCLIARCRVEGKGAERIIRKITPY